MAKNVLMIVVDTLRADYLGCYGHSGGLTPNIDAAAACGCRFDHYYAASDFTAAAFASMFTALYPWQHGVYDFRIKTLPPSPHLAALKHHGYDRKAIVDFGFFKSYLRNSFDDMEALTDLAPNWSIEAPFIEAQRTLDWIGERASRDAPFFCFLHISPPHTPYRFPASCYEQLSARPVYKDGIDAFKADAIGGALLPDAAEGRIPDDAIERFNREYLKVNHVAIEEPVRDFIRLLYAAEVEVVDAVFGRVMRGLGELGLADDTIVSLSADHGEQLWEHGGYGHGISSLYNEVVRTPWILTGGGVGTGTVGANVSHTSLLPTLIELAGVDLPSPATQDSVRDLMENAARCGEVRDAFVETKRRIAVIRGRHKLITRNRRRSFNGILERLRYQLASIRTRLTPFEGRFELYDLVADPAERTNIAGRRRDVVRDLVSALDRFHAQPPASTAGSAPLTEDEESRIKKELAGLGYY